MKKKSNNRVFSRKKDQRKAFLKSLATALVQRGKIKTTEARAKETSSFLERFITKAKKGNLAGSRAVHELFAKRIAKKLIDEIAPKYQNRQGGYTRVIKAGRRRTDGAKMAIIEFVK